MGIARALPRRHRRPRRADDCRQRPQPAHPAPRRRTPSTATAATHRCLRASRPHSCSPPSASSSSPTSRASSRPTPRSASRAICGRGSSAKIAAQDHAYIQQVTPAALLTHLTSDVDAVKMFVVAGDRLAHLVGVPDPRRQRAAHRHRLAAGAGRAGGAAVRRRHLLRRPAAASGRCSSADRRPSTG